MRERQWISRRLLNYPHRNRRASLVASNPSLVFGRNLYPRHVTQTHKRRRPSGGAQNNSFEFAWRLKVGGCHDRKLTPWGLNPTGGNLDILTPKGILDILHREPLAGESIAIKPDSHGIAPITEDTDIGGALQILQSGLNHPIGKVREVH